MTEGTEKKPFRGYVSSYLKVPLRPLDQAQQEQEGSTDRRNATEEDKKPKD